MPIPAVPVVGFIGLGVMGKPMASHVLAKGYRLVVHNRSRGAVDVLEAAGAVAANSPAEVARAATVIVTMLPDSPDVERVVMGTDGLLGALQPGSVVVDMSSIAPAVARTLAAAVAAAGSAMLDAPVSGGEVGAVSATLSIMVGGSAEALAQVRPVLECMGHRIVHVGNEPGSGQLCKICNQMAIAGALAGVSEALALARKADVDPRRVREALLGGFAASKCLEVHGERLIARNFVPGFRAALYQKDLRLASEAAATTGTPIPATALVAQWLDDLVAGGGGDLDYSAIGTVLFRMAGLDPEP